jgi:hypothetical protein
MFVPITKAPPKIRTTTGFPERELPGLVMWSLLWAPSRIWMFIVDSCVSNVGQDLYADFSIFETIARNSSMGPEKSIARGGL